MKIFISCTLSDKIPDRYQKDCKQFIEKIYSDEDKIIFNDDYLTVNDNINIQTERLGLLEYHDGSRRQVTKARMYLMSESDVILFLPGGLNTINELLEFISYQHNNSINKPIILYNSMGYYDYLFAFLSNMYGKKISLLNKGEQCFFTSSVEDTIEYLKELKNSEGKGKVLK